MAKRDYKTTKGGLKVWEHPKNSGIKIRERRNPDGAIGYRISIPTKLTGQRVVVIKQRKTLALAQGFAEQEFVKYSNLGKRAHTMTDAERVQAVEALKLLNGRNTTVDAVVREYVTTTDRLIDLGLSLAECVDFAVARLRPEGGDKTFQQVADELLQIKIDCKLRERSITDFRTRSRKAAERFGPDLIRDITTRDLQEWLTGLNLSFRSRKNYLMVAAEIFNFAVSKKYTQDNPIHALTRQEKKAIQGGVEERQKQPNILSVDKARRLIDAAHEHPKLELLPSVVLGLFCGIRTEEIKRLTWEKHLKLDEPNPYVNVTPDIAKKRSIRHVDIPVNAQAWLARCQRHAGQVAPNKHSTDFGKRFRKLQRLAGFGRTDPESEKWHSTWEENNMRHSFGSYHYALHGDPLLTARLLGHKATDDVLFSHYRALTSKEEATAFFAIAPASDAKNVIEFTKAAAR